MYTDEDIKHEVLRALPYHPCRIPALYFSRLENGIENGQVCAANYVLGADILGFCLFFTGDVRKATRELKRITAHNGGKLLTWHYSVSTAQEINVFAWILAVDIKLPKDQVVWLGKALCRFAVLERSKDLFARRVPYLRDQVFSHYREVPWP